jgi:hypothetical protein
MQRQEMELVAWSKKPLDELYERKRQECSVTRTPYPT